MQVLIVGTFPRKDGTVEVGQFLQKSCENMRISFETLGHTVDTFHYKAIAEENRRWRKWEYRLQKFFRRHFQKKWLPRFCQTALYRLPGIRAMNTQLLKTVKINSYDLVLLAKADLIDYELIPEINKHAPTWYFMNDWIVIAKDIQADKRVANATFASATRSNVTEFFCNAGANAVFLTQGANTRLFYPDPDVPKEYDVVFVGTLRKDRKEYIDYLQANGVKVSTFGKDMEHGHVFGKELADVYRKSKIVLNFNTTINNTGFSLRVFEVMGCGAFLLSEHCKDLETLFTNRKEMVWFKTPQECLDAVREFLQKETDREQIAHKGLKRIQDEFTWDHIIARICDTVTSGRHT